MKYIFGQKKSSLSKAWGPGLLISLGWGEVWVSDCEGEFFRLLLTLVDVL